MKEYIFNYNFVCMVANVIGAYFAWKTYDRGRRRTTDRLHFIMINCFIIINRDNAESFTGSGKVSLTGSNMESYAGSSGKSFIRGDMELHAENSEKPDAMSMLESYAGSNEKSLTADKTENG